MSKISKQWYAVSLEDGVLCGPLPRKAEVVEQFSGKCTKDSFPFYTSNSQKFGGLYICEGRFRNGSTGRIYIATHRIFMRDGFRWAFDAKVSNI